MPFLDQDIARAPFVDYSGEPYEDSTDKDKILKHFKKILLPEHMGCIVEELFVRDLPSSKRDKFGVPDPQGHQRMYCMMCGGYVRTDNNNNMHSNMLQHALRCPSATHFGAQIMCPKPGCTERLYCDWTALQTHWAGHAMPDIPYANLMIWRTSYPPGYAKQAHFPHLFRPPDGCFTAQPLINLT